VNVHIHDHLPARADMQLLESALENLIGNAWKFSSKRSDAKIQIASKGQGDAREFFVRDNGAGLDMNYADKLFGPFQRLHSQKDFPGTGIGLATVQRIVHRHGGRIRVESTPGEGATFFFTLHERSGT
jgi:light-regulated signal transduction histidine kinase (bacteriophytochrome)